MLKARRKRRVLGTKLRRSRREASSPKHAPACVEPEFEIRELLRKAGISARDALRMREEGAKALKVDGDEAEIIAAMAQRPELLQRPFVVNGDQAVLARPIDRALEVL